MGERNNMNSVGFVRGFTESNGDRKSLNGVCLYKDDYDWGLVVWDGYYEFQCTVMTGRGAMSEETGTNALCSLRSCYFLKNDNDVCERRENIINGLLMNEDDFPSQLDAIW